MPPDRNPSSASAAESVDTTAVGAFLRALAERAERDPAFGRQIAALLAESGLLHAGAASVGAPHSPRTRAGRAPVTAAATSPDAVPQPDPFAVLREHGEANLRKRLDTLDLAALRQIIRAHRLDPARISARWANRERLVALIVDQVRARADHGKAFSRV